MCARLSVRHGAAGRSEDGEPDDEDAPDDADASDGADASASDGASASASASAATGVGAAVSGVLGISHFFCAANCGAIGS